MPPRDRQSPPRIPGYRLERALGEGGMATAWLASQLSLGREVALKVLDPALAADQAFVERFLREARVLAALRHRHIVAIHDVGLAEGVPYLAMEYVPGGSIVPLCGQCDAATALRCVREIAEALGHAHARGIVHRDVKPENILRGEDGGFVLGDFGIARVSDAGALAAPTGPGLAFGTPAYMAPERWRDGAVDGRSDFYALGCVLHALLTARPPYAASEILALGHKHLNEPIPLLPAPFEALQGLLARLLAKDPADRHPDAAALVAHVQVLEREIGGGERTSSGETRLLAEWPFSAAATPVSTEVRAPKPSAEPVHRISPSWAFVLLLAFIGLAALGLFASGRLPPGSGDAPPPPSAPVIAVLPLHADGQDPELTRLASVVAEDLTVQLARLEGLQVVARTSVLAVTQSPQDAQTVAQRLGAGLLVEGSVRRNAGGEIGIHLQLVDGRTGSQRGGTQASAPLDRLSSAEGELLDWLAAELLPGREAPRLELRASSSRDANAAYQRGRTLQAEAAGISDLQAARAAFEQALTIDPSFAPAYAAACRAGLDAFKITRDPSEFQLAKQACDQAVAIDADSPDVQVLLGRFHSVQGEHAIAISYFERVLDDPALRGDALLGMARSQAALGRNAEAERSYRRAQSLLPGQWVQYAELGNFYIATSRYADAADAFQAALALGGDTDARVHNGLGSALLGADRLEEAEAAYSRALELRVTHSAISNLGSVRFFLGNYQGAAELFRQALAMQPNDYRMYGNLADALSAAGGEPAEVRALYERAANGAKGYLDVQGDSIEAAASLAWFWVNTGRTEGARALLLGAAEREVSDGAVPYRLAGAWLRLGDIERARAQLDRAIALDYSARMIAGTPWLRPLLATEGAVRGDPAETPR